VTTVAHEELILDPTFLTILKIIPVVQSLGHRKPPMELRVIYAASVLKARNGSADREERCANLFEDRTLPGAGSIVMAWRHLNTSLMVMIRPRRGGSLDTDL
jgi:hypothetical protein